jgi:hypothetical protein
MRRALLLSVAAVLLACGSVLAQGPPSSLAGTDVLSEAPCKRRPTRRRHSGKEPPERKLPSFKYYLDESDPDIVVLCRQDGSFVAAFSADGVTKEGITEAAKEDYKKVVRKWLESGGGSA